MAPSLASSSSSAASAATTTTTAATASSSSLASSLSTTAFPLLLLFLLPAYLPPSLATAFVVAPTVTTTTRPIRGDVGGGRRRFGRVAAAGEADIEEAPFPSTTDGLGGDEAAKFEELCASMGVSTGRLKLESNGSVRGLFAASDLRESDVVLSIPLQCCLRDDDPPSWLPPPPEEDAEERNDDGNGSFRAAAASRWPTNLAASLLDLRLRTEERHEEEDEEERPDGDAGTELWLSMLPDVNVLRSSLPVHWSEETLSSAGCRMLESAAGSAYFSRCESVGILMEGLGNRRSRSSLSSRRRRSEEELERMCHDALDVVQTRCCGVTTTTTTDGGEHLRIVAPAFDFFNHGTAVPPEDGSPNASFALEEEAEGEEDRDVEPGSKATAATARGGGPSLVVRTSRDVPSGEELLIDYGASAASNWKCLASYGFVPSSSSSGRLGDTAELCVNGVRAEVGGDSVPFELIEATYGAMGLTLSDDVENPLTAQVAFCIADIAANAAEELSKLPSTVDSAGLSEGGEVEERGFDDSISMNLALSLRKSQERVLGRWSSGLRRYAETTTS